MDRGRGYYRWARKLLHIAGGIGAITLPFIPYWLAVAAAVAAVLLARVLKPKHVWWLRAMSKPEDRLRGVITGVRGYCLVVLLLILLWPVLEAVTWIGADAVRYVMFGWLALALGDGLAGLIGPGPSMAATVFWSRQKTWWGFAACMVGTLAAYAICFIPAWGGTASAAVGSVLTTGGVLAVITALLESLETSYDDNYLVGLAPPLLALILLALKV